MSGAYVNVRSVPPALKRALINDAAEKRSSVSAVSAALVAKELGVKLLDGRRKKPKPRPTTNPAVNDQLNIRLPDPAMVVMLDERAAALDLTRSSYVIMILAKHYGLPHWPARPGGSRGG